MRTFSSSIVVPQCPSLPLDLRSASAAQVGALIFELLACQQFKQIEMYQSALLARDVIQMRLDSVPITNISESPTYVTLSPDSILRHLGFGEEDPF